jgi:predicted nucleotidyltransferase
MRRVWRHWNKSDANIISGDMVLNQDFKEFIQSLNNKQVRYLIIGGYAVAFHGHPRYTKDLDVWVELSQDNAARLVAALAEFGFGSLGLQDSDFLEPDQVIQLGYPPNRIDVIMTPKGVDFASCYAKRVIGEADGITFNIIDLESLLQNKRATGRHQDLADVENLEPQR